MRLQQASRCALFALAEMACDRSRLFSAADLARKYGLSVNHLAKVLPVLAHAGLLESVRGIGGGYRFCGDINRVTLLHVIALFEPIAHDGTAQAPQARLVERAMMGMEQKARLPFSSTTLAEFLRQSGRL
jgi:Rrf2 family transcriptional regulator, nitric oxide-sensitive transcriptional repressor